MLPLLSEAFKKMDSRAGASVGRLEETINAIVYSTGNSLQQFSNRDSAVAYKLFTDRNNPSEIEQRPNYKLESTCVRSNGDTCGSRPTSSFMTTSWRQR